MTAAHDDLPYHAQPQHTPEWHAALAEKIALETGSQPPMWGDPEWVAWLNARIALAQVHATLARVSD